MKFRDLIPWQREKEDGIFKHETESPFFALQREMNRMFDDFSKSFFDHSPMFKGTDFHPAVDPKVDVVETDKTVEITAELAGMDEKDIDVSFNHDMLIIKGEKKAEREDKKEGYYLMERSYGSFHRAIPVPAGVDSNKVEAKFKNGVLKVTLPKTEEAQKNSKKIPVNAS